MNSADRAAKDFAFDFHARRPRISTQEMLDSLQAFAPRFRGRPFTMKQFDDWRDRAASAQAIATRFGRWRKALEAAGVKGARNGEWDAQDLMNTLEDAWRRLGHRPGASNLKRLAGVSHAPFASRWGSLPRACELLARFHAGEISRAQLLAPIKRRTRQPLKPSLRWAILKRDNFQCTLCGQRATSKSRTRINLEVDHIIPVSQGGTNDPKNLRTLCTACNQGRGNDRRKLAA
jgi:hypothetical protein